MLHFYVECNHDAKNLIGLCDLCYYYTVSYLLLLLFSH